MYRDNRWVLYRARMKRHEVWPIPREVLDLSEVFQDKCHDKNIE